MRKADAIDLLGGTVASAATELRVTYQAVDKWPELLPQRIVDRVLAAWVRKHLSDRLPRAFDESGIADGQQQAQEARHAA